MFSGCLFNCMKTRGPWENCQGVETQKKTKDITRTSEKRFLYEIQMNLKPADLLNIILHVIE